MSPSRPRAAIPVVLAAGLGTRMKSRLPKLLHPICGRPMLAYVLDAVTEATGTRPLVVYSPQTEAVRRAFAEDADFALQDEPRGTADAVRAALEHLAADTAEVVVVNGDVPLLETDLVAELVRERRANDAAIALLTVDAAVPEGLGRIKRDAEGQVTRVVEHKDAAEHELEISEINVGLYAFDAAWLRKRLPQIPPSPATGELYLPVLVELARDDGRDVVALQVEDDGTLYGINDRAQLATAELDMRLRINEAHMKAGVTMLDPTTALIDYGVQLAEDVTLEPNVILRGATRIGRDTVIRTGSQILDSQVGERNMIWASVLESSVVEDDCRIGPFAHLRAGSHIASNVELGNYAEVKKSRIGRGSKQHHFSYIGDADVGEGVNIGAGTITANYDGVRKYPTTIRDRAFIGSDTILRAPVTVGEGAYTGAAAVVTRDVPPGKIALGIPARIRERRSPEESEGGAEPSGATKSNAPEEAGPNA